MVVAPEPDAQPLEPLRLPWQLRLTPEPYEQGCQERLDAVFEFIADGQLIATTPTGSETGARNSALGLAVRGSGLPLKQFDRSTGFRLPDASGLSTDASLIRLERWNALTPEQRL